MSSFLSIIVPWYVLEKTEVQSHSGPPYFGLTSFLRISLVKSE